MHPVGPLNPKVYWVRRVSIVVLAVAVLIGMVWFLASRTSRSSAGPDQAAAVANTSAAPTLTGVLAASSGAGRSTVPSPSPSSSVSPSGTAPVASSGAVASSPAKTSPAATDPAAVAAAEAAAAQAAADAAALAAAQAAAAAPTTDTAPPAAVEPPPAPEPTPSFDAKGKLICPAASVSVTAITSAPSYVAGGQPMLGMVVTNTGPTACQQDVSGTLQMFTVTAADGTRVWSTTDCFPGEGTEVRELTPGQTVQYTIKWSGTSSAAGCAGDRAVVPAGDYAVVAQLGGLSSPPATFVITG